VHPPPETKPQSSNAPLELSVRNVASSSAGWFDSCILYTYETRSICSLRALLTAGCRIPTHETAAPPIASSNFWPLSSSMYIPSAATATGGIHGVRCKIDVGLGATLEGTGAAGLDTSAGDILRWSQRSLGPEFIITASIEEIPGLLLSPAASAAIGFQRGEHESGAQYGTPWYPKERENETPPRNRKPAIFKNESHAVTFYIEYVFGACSTRVGAGFSESSLHRINQVETGRDGFVRCVRMQLSSDITPTSSIKFLRGKRGHR
jgi:hypothetical protein